MGVLRSRGNFRSNFHVVELAERFAGSLFCVWKESCEIEVVFFESVKDFLDSF
jgi:hypothetical protein